MELKDVQKLGCEPAKEGPGYFCTYTTRTVIGASSNETTSDGIAHARAADIILKTYGDGAGVVDQNTQRFIKSGKAWELVPNG